MQHKRIKPEEQPTRGKTAANRLRRMDNFIPHYESPLLTRTDGLFADAMFVDLGYGFETRTALESASHLRRVNPDLKVLGVEIDPGRVEAALPHTDEKTFFRLGGFNLPLQSGETVRLIRAFNVLHQYKEKDFIPAYERLLQYVLPGYLMIEGTSNPFDRMWAANVVRRTMESGNPFPDSRSRLSEVKISGDLKRWSSAPTSTPVSTWRSFRQFYQRIILITWWKANQPTISLKRGKHPPRRPLMQKPSNWGVIHLGGGGIVAKRI